MSKINHVKVKGVKIVHGVSRSVFPDFLIRPLPYAIIESHFKSEVYLFHAE